MELWPINRSITGSGVRNTLGRIQKHVPDLKIYSVPTGTVAYDWIVPKEWAVNDAYIIGPSGNKMCDFRENNLHLLGYSIPVDREIEFDELVDHLYNLPDQPDAISYITSYYKQSWGFCLSQNQFDTLEEGTYHVKIEWE